MANTKITELTALTQCAATDVLPIVSVSASTTKKVSISDLLRNAPDGTADAPSIANAGDQDTGIFFPAADSVAVSTAGTQQLVIDSFGDVGIGVASPGLRLHVQDGALASAPTPSANCDVVIEDSTNTGIQFLSSTQAELRFGDAGHTGAGNIIYNHSSNYLSISTNEDERVRIDSSGRVGIGASNNSSYDSAAQNLLVADESDNAGITIRSGGGTPFGAIHFADGTSNNDEKRAGRIMYGHSGDFMLFSTANSERVRIDSNGRLLVGTSSARTNVFQTSANITPNHQIETNQFSYDGGLSIINCSSVGHSPVLTLGVSKSTAIGSNGLVDDDTIAGIVNFTANDGTNFRTTAQVKAEIDGTPGSSNMPGRLMFLTNGGAATPTERMRIDSSGRVGIGTSSPSTKFVVSNGGAEGVEFSHASGTNEINSYNRSSSARAPVDIIGQTFKVLTGNPSLSTGLFQDSSGNVGVGTTSLFSATGYGALTLSGSTGGALALAEGSTRRFEIYGDNTNGLRVYDRTNTTERLRIDNSGNVGISTTTPTFGQSTPISTYNPKLGVEGSIIVGNLSATASDRSELQFYRRAGSAAGQPLSNHDMGKIAWYGSSNDTDNANLAWSIGVTADGNSWTSGSERKGHMTFNNHNGEQLRINSVGYVGLGIDSITQKLHVEGTANNQNSEIRITATQVASGYLGANANGLNIGADTGGVVFKTGVTGGGSVGGSGTERFRLTSDGKLGVGTSTPITTLDVRGGLTVQSGQAIGSTSSGGTLQIQGGASLPGGNIVLAGGSGSGENNIKFRTNGTDERARIDSSGRLLVGKSSADLSNSKLEITGASNANFLSILNESASDVEGNRYSKLFFRGTQSGGETSTLCSVQSAHDGTADDQAGRITFHTNDGSDNDSPTERMRINRVGTVAIGTGGFDTSYRVNIKNTSSGGGLGLINSSSNSDTAIAFFNSGQGTIGSITTSSTNTAFNTSSDYRLKENVVAVTDGITRVKQLQPKRFNFIADDSRTVDGFLAHEAQTVVPEAVTGTHNEVDDDNNPVYQGIDQSKLVPLLTAALQEAIAKIETLETKVAALEAQ